MIKRKTARKRLGRALKRVAQWCRQVRHQPIREQWRRLSQKVRGHCQYYGITGNGRALIQFRNGVILLWRKWLSRRSRRRGLTWDRIYQVLRWLPLPPAQVVHSVYRLAAKP